MPMSSSFTARMRAYCTKGGSFRFRPSTLLMISIKRQWRPGPSQSSCSTASKAMMPESKPPLRILFELRPALGGHAGIPQATRLLFRSLALLKDVDVGGLLQSAERSLTPGLPQRVGGPFGSLSADQQINRLSRIVIGIETGS